MVSGLPGCPMGSWRANLLKSIEPPAFEEPEELSDLEALDSVLAGLGIASANGISSKM